MKHKMQKNKGFTLIELMIVVGIIALLASFAVPAYNSYVQRGYRADARAELMEAAQNLMRYYSVQNTYVGATLPATRSPASGTKRYDISVAATAVGFTVSAKPVSDPTCGTLTLTETGVRGVSFGDVNECWR